MRNMGLAVAAVAAAIIVALSYANTEPSLPLMPPDQAGSPQLGVSRAYVPPSYGVPALEWELRYHVGMSRDQIRQRLPRDIHWLASVSRPAKGWKALEEDQPAVAYWVTNFEAGHPGPEVAACDLLMTGGGDHFLFYDSAGLLVGVKRIGGYGVLSAATGPANHPPEVDAGFAHGLTSDRPWRSVVP